MNTLQPRATLTIADFLAEFGVESQSAHVFFLKVEAAVRATAERLVPVVEKIAGGLLKLPERILAALEVHGARGAEAVASFQSFGRVAATGVRALISEAENIGRKAILFVEAVENTPKIDGHEELLITRLNYHPLVVRLIVHAVHKFGERFADEQNGGRKAGVRVGRLAKAGLGTLAISRRATKLRELMREPHSDSALQLGIARTAIRLSLSDFKDLVDRAACRNLKACQALVEVCRQLAPALPSPHGRPLAKATAIHASLLLFLDHLRVFGAYTHDAVHKGDEVDAFTLSTRIALHMQSFRPQAAMALLWSGEFGQPSRPRKKRGVRETAPSRVRAKPS